MEIKINKEIRDYTENIFFGLSLRQFVCSALACIVAIGLYFLSSKFLGTEGISWICILGASPFAILGFFKYNGLPAEKILFCIIKSEILTPKKLTFKSTNFYYELLNNKRKEEKKNENIKRIIQKR